jgi:hypothetical protein
MFMGKEDFEIIEREACFSGFYRLERLRLRHRQFAGGMGPELSRELFVRHDAVCVLPYDPQRDEVVLIEQFRVGALDKSANPWLLELVAGLIDKDEQPEEVARREALEEANLPITSLWPITQYYCLSAAATRRAPEACMAWPRKARTSGFMSGRCRTPWPQCATGASITLRASLPCNGWRSIATKSGACGREPATRTLPGRPDRAAERL